MCNPTYNLVFKHNPYIMFLHQHITKFLCSSSSSRSHRAMTGPSSATRSDHLQRSLLLYLHQRKVQSFLLVGLQLMTTFICTHKVPLFLLLHSLCGGSGGTDQRRNTLMSIQQLYFSWYYRRKNADMLSILLPNLESQVS